MLDLKETKKLVSQAVANSQYIESACLYGSALYSNEVLDFDIAVIVESNSYGIVEPSLYKALKQLRQELIKKCQRDIDIVPHTKDEFKDFSSPLWSPRYHPVLRFGEVIKGDFSPLQNFDLKPLKPAEIAACILHENRTACRRQLVRSFRCEEARIFKSKLLHGPSNALTYYSLKNNLDYLLSPSNFSYSIELFDRIFETNSQKILEFFAKRKERLSFKEASKLLFWYENLVALVLYDQPVYNYQRSCLNLNE